MIVGRGGLHAQSEVRVFLLTALVQHDKRAARVGLIDTRAQAEVLSEEARHAEAGTWCRFVAATLSPGAEERMPQNGERPQASLFIEEVFQEKRIRRQAHSVTDTHDDELVRSIRSGVLSER
jgi:hypothetical protein